MVASVMNTESIMSRREEIAQKKNELKKREEQNLTFSPKINSRKAKGPNEIESAQDRLYWNALLKRLASKTASTQQRSESPERSVSPAKTQTRNTSPQRTTSTTVSTTSTVSLTLSPTPTRATKKRANPSPSPSHKSTPTPTPKPVVRQTRASSSSGLRPQDRTSRVSSACSSRASSRSSSISSRGSITSRDSACSFKPSIPSYTVQGRSSSQSDLTARLYSEANILKAKLDRLQKKQQEDEIKDTPFSPKFSSNYKSKTKENKGCVIQRMHQLEEKKQKKIQEKVKAKEATVLDGYTFHPDTTPTRGSNPNRNKKNNKAADEDKDASKTTTKTKTIMSPHERLYKDSQERKSQKEEKKLKVQSEMEWECTFTPSINPITEAFGFQKRVHISIFERAGMSDSRLYMESMLATVKDQLEMKNCSFTPSLATSSRCLKLR